MMAFAVLAGMTLLAPARPTPSGQAGACSPDSVLTQQWLESLRQIYASLDSTYLASIGHPVARGSGIQAVAAESVCAHARDAYNTFKGWQGTPEAIESVHVFALGSGGFVVINPADTAAGRTNLFIFSPQWSHVTTIQA
jgi:hypothetical protein